MSVDGLRPFPILQDAVPPPPPPPAPHTWARAQLQEGTSSSLLTGESEAEHALSETTGPQTHAGLPL